MKFAVTEEELFTEVKNKSYSEIRRFLKSKQPIKEFNRAEVEKIFKPAFTEIANAPRSWDDNFMKALYVRLLGIKDQILNLQIDRDRIESCLSKNFIRVENYVTGEQISYADFADLICKGDTDE